MIKRTVYSLAALVLSTGVAMAFGANNITVSKDKRTAIAPHGSSNYTPVHVPK